MKYILILSIFALQSCFNNSNADTSHIEEVKAVVDNVPPQDTTKKIVKTEKEWKSELSKQEYYVLREAGTERPHTGDLLKNKEEGVYTCRGCGAGLFSSGSKFESGTGWPSFFEPLNGECVTEDTDYKLGYARTEILCARCDGHLGHVFPDGPKPIGLRYCVNSVSLDFEKKEETMDK